MQIFSALSRYGVRIAAPVVALLAVSTVHAEDPGWPREIVVDGYRITMFQPQPETFTGIELTARAAVSVTPDDKAPVFGAVWIRARVETDRDTRIIVVTDVDIDRVRFPSASEEQAAALAALLEREMPTWDVQMSLDRLTATLEEIGGPAETKGLSFEPPSVVIRQSPAVLVTIDGDPKVQALEGSELSRVVNTPFLIVRKDATYFLFAGADAWYTATDIMGTWTYTAYVPSDVAELAPDSSDLDLPEADEAANSGVIPELIVVTEPTELIYTDGAPTYTPIGTGELMYVSNTDSTVVLHVESQQHFILISGRWYASQTVAGPWTHYPSEDLPEAFQRIEDESEIADVRAHVAGTDQANDAVLDAMIPQTAEVERGPADIDVEYDGEPQFEAIPGTGIEWAKNTPAQVLRSEGRYWVVSDGVWYVGGTPTGPWEVATERPQQVDDIPADNPNHNTKYVYVFDSTPDVVYVGYTPGYTHTYIHGGTIVYGTGWWYAPWYGSYYYPRHSTWGFHVRWNPWTGWSFGLTYSNGRFTFGIGFGGWGRWHGGWWGPGGFHGYWRGYHRGFYHGWNRGFYHGARAGYRAGARAGYRRANLYSSRPQPRPVRTAQPRAATRDRVNAPGAVSRTQANNVFTDRNGDVFRRDGSGNWQQRTGNDWQNVGTAQRPNAGERPAQRPSAEQRPAQRPAQQPGQVQRPATNQQQNNLQSLERQSNARQRGTRSANSFRSGSSRTGRSGGGGVRRRR